MSKIQDLRRYELVFTTSCAYTHGVSGHLYELIDYFHIASTNGIKSAILLTDGITYDLLEQSILDKYNFTEAERNNILDNTIECYRPKIVTTQNICIVDGSWRLGDCTVFANNAFLLRCSEDDFTYFDKHKTIKRTHLMQDFKLYPERFENLNITVVDYVKKILWQKYHQPSQVKTGTALFYLTSNCRALPPEDIKLVMDKYRHDKYLIVTNNTALYKSLQSETVEIAKVPVQNIFDKFDTYIYTKIIVPPMWGMNRIEDCSPRFIVECAAFGKNVIYDLDYVDRGVECRRAAIENDIMALQLTSEDYFIDYVKQQIHTNN